MRTVLLSGIVTGKLYQSPLLFFNNQRSSRFSSYRSMPRDFYFYGGYKTAARLWGGLRACTRNAFNDQRISDGALNGFRSEVK